MTKKTILIGGLLCGLALVLTPPIRGQKPSVPTQPGPGIRADYTFVSALKENPTLGTHQSVTDAHFGPVAFSDRGEIVFVAQFFDPRTGPVRGIFFADGREIATDGSKLGGDIAILNIRAGEPYDLQINKLGQVTFLALIQSKACGAMASCNGLFEDGRLAAVTSASTPGGYSLGDDGKITAPAGHSWFTPAAIVTPAGATEAKKPGFLRKLGKAASAIQVNLPVAIKTPGGGRGVANVSGSATTDTAGQPGQGQRPGQAGQQKAPFEGMMQLPYCTTPAEVWPNQWTASTNAAGPIASGRQGGPPPNFTSVLHPQIHRWYSKVWFAADCREILVAAIESPGVTQELWSPVGLITTFESATGAYVFNGVPPVALPAANSPIEAGVLINRRCQVLANVSFKKATGDESAIIIGKPTKPGHCPVE